VKATSTRRLVADPALAWSHGLEVEVGGAETLAQAGVVLPRLLADRLGLTTGLAQVVAQAGFVPVRHRGRALVDATCALAAGATCLSDVEATTAQEEIFGPEGGASDSTMFALGIGVDGSKHPLSLVEGSTENTTLVTELIVGLGERGLDVTRPILAVLDGSKALRRAVLDVFDRPVIARCQLHKIRNVQDRLPEKMRSVVASRMRRAYHADSALAAEAELNALAAELDRTHPSAATSLREGMTETLTVLRLAVPPTLARTLRSTNAIESMISICRDHARNVKRWRRADGAALVRRRHGRGRQAAPTGQRPPTPTIAARHARAGHQTCQ
jgi:hypothetical protein